MKKIINAITLFLIIAIFSEVSYAAEYLNSVEFNRKRMDENIIWSGKEWITDTYPPKISQDATEFMSVEENEDVKEELKNYRYIYVWTGNDYLVYQSNPDYRKYNMQKYLYRLSADFQQILNIYEKYCGNRILSYNQPFSFIYTPSLLIVTSCFGLYGIFSIFSHV